jgi:hypothetical protein
MGGKAGLRIAYSNQKLFLNIEVMIVEINSG